MSLKNTLTNEQLNKRFTNPFSLVNYAISLAKVRVDRGEGIDSNPANDVLELIATSGDKLPNLEEVENIEEEKEAV
ncbi:MAG: hypothetical protein JJU12_04695 [Chlamydiales bacterium]|nr:hypothetical protein [Chlamydiales bacterium]